MNPCVSYYYCMDNTIAAAISCSAAAARQARDIILEYEPTLNSRYSSEKRAAADFIVCAEDVLRLFVQQCEKYDERAFLANTADVVSPAQTWQDVQYLRTFYNAPETRAAFKLATEIRRVAAACDSVAKRLLDGRMGWGITTVDDAAEVAVIRALVYCLDVDLARLVADDATLKNIDLGNMGAHCDDGGLRSYLTDARVLADDADVDVDGMVSRAWAQKLAADSVTVLICPDFTIYKRIKDGELYYLNDDNVA